MKDIADDLRKLCEKYHSLLTEEIKKEINNKVMKHFNLVVFKNVDILFSISNILSHSTPNQSYFSIGLLLRSGLLDALTTLHLLYFAKVSFDSIENKIDHLHSDQLKRVLAIELNKNNFSKEDKEQICKDINTNYGHLFEEEITIDNLTPKFKYPNPFANAKQMSNTSIALDQSQDIYMQYSYFSKFEHIGTVSEKLYSSIHDHNNVKEELTRIATSLIQILFFTDMLKVHLDIKNLELNNDIKEFNDKLIEKIKKDYI